MKKFWHSNRKTNKKLPEGLKRGVSSTYSSWNAMMNRCFNKKYNGYERWGGRGITVCKRWHNYDNFILDMGKVPKGLSLDRIDVNGNYSKENYKFGLRHKVGKTTTIVAYIYIPKEVYEEITK